MITRMRDGTGRRHYRYDPDYLRRAADALAGDLRPRLISDVGVEQ